jgi:hypothetical protein
MTLESTDAGMAFGSGCVCVRACVCGFDCFLRFALARLLFFFLLAPTIAAGGRTAAFFFRGTRLLLGLAYVWNTLGPAAAAAAAEEEEEEEEEERAGWETLEEDEEGCASTVVSSIPWVVLMSGLHREVASAVAIVALPAAAKEEEEEEEATNALSVYPRTLDVRELNFDCSAASLASKGLVAGICSLTARVRSERDFAAQYSGPGRSFSTLNFPSLYFNSRSCADATALIVVAVSCATNVYFF